MRKQNNALTYQTQNSCKNFFMPNKLLQTQKIKFYSILLTSLQ